MAAFTKVFSNRPFAGTVLFLMLLYCFEEWLFDFPQVRFFQQVIAFCPQHEVLIAVISGIGSFAICYLIIWSALVSSRPFQALYSFLLGLSTLLQYGFWKALRRFITTADLQIASATPWNTWLGAGAIYLNWWFIIPLLG